MLPWVRRRSLYASTLHSRQHDTDIEWIQLDEAR